MKNMKRILVYAISIVVCILLETTVFQNLALASVVPNLMIILVSGFGLARGKNEGMLLGFFGGLVHDVLFGNLLGFCALLYMIIGYLNGCFSRIFYGDDDIKLPILLVAGSDLLFGIMTYILLFLLKSDFNFRFYLRSIIMPEVIYTALVSIILSHVIMKINFRLEEEEKRSAGKFV